ncbi:MAG: hypothetical protein K8M05_07195 [Deltaproteobacteria bacterium]|nr:hypothetical protein [Kofleriaceae bacterium]
MPVELPPCGLYRTVNAIAEVPAGRLVYFHNHGNPGPGVYLPERWVANRARFSGNGFTLPRPDDARALQPLLREGFYRVTAAFHCCAKRCTEFLPEMLVQLGYNGAARALLFLPEITAQGLAVPERGAMVDDERLANLVALQVREGSGVDAELSLPRGMNLH